MNVNTEDFNLTLLRASYFDGYLIEIDKFSTREVYDYEIEYYISSDGGIVINGEFTPFEKGSINFRVPGQLVRGVSPYKCYLLLFDILGDKDKITKDYLLGSKDKQQPLYNNKILSNIPNKINSNTSTNMEGLIKKIYRLYNDGSEIALLKSKGLLYQLITELYDYTNPDNPRKTGFNTYTNKAINYIQQNFTRNIKIEEISNYLGINVNYFQNIFKENVGVTPKQYINNLRLERSKILLATTEISIAEIGSMCGFDDNVYFSFFFKKSESFTPKQYRKLHNIY